MTQKYIHYLDYLSFLASIFEGLELELLYIGGGWSLILLCSCFLRN